MYMRSIRSSGVGNIIVSFCVPGSGDQTSRKEKYCISPGGGGGAWLQIKLQHAIAAFSFVCDTGQQHTMARSERAP